MKQISELTDEERARLYPIILSEYKPRWAEWYEDEKRLIEKLICGCDLRINHIGSTSIAGLTAKPTIDILLEISPDVDFSGLRSRFPCPEYICIDKQTTASNDILLFLKGYTPTGFAEKVFHIHVRRNGDWDELYFKAYLAAHPQAAREYSALKISLRDKYTYDRDGYTEAKGQFIREITAKARGKYSKDLAFYAESDKIKG